MIKDTYYSYELLAPVIDGPSTSALVEGFASAPIINLAVRLGVTLVD